MWLFGETPDYVMYRRYDPMFIMGVCQIHSYLVYTAAHQTWLQLGGCLAALFILMNWEAYSHLLEPPTVEKIGD
ncbi:unnamed protein product [Brassica oleracea]